MQHLGVVERAMAILYHEPMTGDDRVEIVPRLVGVESAAQAGSAQPIHVEPRTDFTEGVFDKTIIEVHIVGDKYRAVQEQLEVVGNTAE